MKQKLILLTVLLTALSAFPSEYYVDASRPDDSGAATNWASAKKTIQAAVNLTVNGDIVWVTNGTYEPIGVTNAIAIRSVKGPAVTIINGGGVQRCAKLATGVTLDGLTLTNGYAEGARWYDRAGGGVDCDGSAMITNCVITGNYAEFIGAGVRGGTLYNCIIRANSGPSSGGGGAALSALDDCIVDGNQSGWLGGGAYECQLSRCLITNNVAVCDGGGVYGSTLNACTLVGNTTDSYSGGGASDSVLNNCLVVGNRAGFGGGAHECTLINCTVTKNVATNDTGDSLGGGVAFSILRNSIVFNNSASENFDCYWAEWNGGLDAQYSCFSEATNGLNGNISVNPKFVDVAAGNYRLQSESPCVNAGINADVSGSVDLDGNERIVHTYVDIGAYESTYNSPKQYIRDFLPTNGTTFSITNTVHLSTTGGGSGKPVTFTNLPGCPVIWVNSTTMQFSAGGDIYITASQAGDSYYDAAGTVTNHYLVPYSGIFYVDVSRPDDTGFATNWTTAKRTIQAAVNLAADGSTIWVTNGTYILSAEISVTNAITIHSVNGPRVTIVNGGGGNRCLNLSSECLVSGFTITNGFASGEYPYWNGGGIYCSTPFSMVSNCVISGNSVGYGNDFGISDGGGMSGGFAVECVFSGNTAGGGGGMSGGVASNCSFIGNLAEGGGPLFNNPGSFGGGGMSYGAAYNCTFTSNSANWSGGGMFRGTAYNCLFTKNSAGYYGGGMDSVVAYGCLFNGNSSHMGGGGGYSTWYNCTFVGNISAYGAGISGGTAYNCIFSGNTVYDEAFPVDIYNSTAYNSCSLDIEHGVNGNITNAPLFVDAANGIFRLQSNSPCINWGNNSYVTNATDLGGNPRIVEGVVDMGAYEYQGIVGLSDSDSDGISDDWERQHGGNQKPDRVCSNGVNTILQAYIAGLDPNNSQSKFQTSVFRSPTSGTALQWQGVSGRVYAIYFSTNLLNGFQPLETNIPWTAGCFTDSVHNAEQRFYRIEVKKP